MSVIDRAIFKRPAERGHSGHPVIFFLFSLLIMGIAAVTAYAGDGDPEVTWNTFLGSAGAESSYFKAAALDQEGNIYVTGNSDASWGTPLNAHSGGKKDLFLAKLDRSGNLLWNTFLGGAEFEIGTGITVDGDDIYIIGEGSGDWAVAGVSPFGGPWAGGGNDTFLAKLDRNGNLLWHTFLGSLTSGAKEIALDGEGYVYGTGYCRSQFGSPVIRPYQGGGDAFLVKLDPENGNILWTTFLGGPTELDACATLVIDKEGRIFVGGASQGTWGDPLQPHMVEGTYNGLVAELDTDGHLIRHTFFGTTSHTTVSHMAMDAYGGLYLTGECRGQWGTPVRNYTGKGDAYVSKLDKGMDLVWNTYLGGVELDRGYLVELDGNGYVYATGLSNIGWGDDPVRPYLGSADPYVAKLDPNGRLVWHGFFGTSGDDGSSPGHANLAVDPGGNVVVSSTCEASWGDPVDPFEGKGEKDLYVALISDPQAKDTDILGLTVKKGGTGTGRVISRPAGIFCGEDCDALFTQGSTMTLTAVPDEGFVLDGWTGIPPAGNGPCRFNLTESMIVTAIFNPDSDGDGISDAVEDEVPGQGDGNGDGLKDSRQANVASFRDVYEKWCTMETETGTQIKGLKAAVDPLVAPGEPEWDRFLSGFISFRIQGLTPGQATIATITLHETETDITEYWKYGPTEDDRVPHWYEFNWDGLTGAKIDYPVDRIVIQLHFKDGDRGDDDLLENGEIEDLGGPTGHVSGGGYETDDGSGCFIQTLTRRP